MSHDVVHGALAIPSRRRLLHHLRAADHPADIPALSAATGLHPNTVRFHLDVLVRAGLVEETRDRRGTRGRPRTVYTPVMQVGHDRGYQVLAEMLVNHLDQSGHATAAEDAGRAWARQIKSTLGAGPSDATSAARAVTALFAEMGFEPVVTTNGTGSRIDLHACPFRAVAERHPAVVCTLHRGLLAELVDQLTAGTVDTALVPFAEPGLCVADLVVAEPVRTA
jgi:predicted ArsR family transcriptional regulator